MSIEKKLPHHKHCPFYESASRNSGAFCKIYNIQGCWQASFSNCEVWAIISDKDYLFGTRCSELAEFLYKETTREDRISMERQGGIISHEFLEKIEQALYSQK